MNLRKNLDTTKSYHDVTVRERVGGPELENVQNFVRI